MAWGRPDPVMGAAVGGCDGETLHCPGAGPRCESCGDLDPGVAMVVVRFGDLGCGCVSLCPHCADQARVGNAPWVAVATAQKIIAQHAEHRGGTR